MVNNLNKFVELCGGNESEAARKLGVEPPQLWEWRKGKHAPTKATRVALAAKIGISVSGLMYGTPQINEPPQPYGVKLSDRAERLVKRLIKLVSNGEGGCLEFIDNQITQAEKIFTVSALHSDRLIPDVRLDPLHDRRRTAGVSEDAELQSAPTAETTAAGAVQARRTKKRRSD